MRARKEIARILNNIGYERFLANKPKRYTRLAMICFGISSLLGCSTAMVNMGNIYEDEKHYKHAYLWYKRAARHHIKVGSMLPICIIGEIM